MGTEEPEQQQKIKIVENAIFCVGDSKFVLMFDYKNGSWQQIQLDQKESDYQGTLKYASVC